MSEKIKPFWVDLVTGDLPKQKTLSEFLEEHRIKYETQKSDLEAFADGMEAQEMLDSDKVKVDKDVFLALGNGDVEKGVEFLFRFAKGIERARGLHNSKEWEFFGEVNSMDWIQDEVKELVHEIEENLDYNNSQRIEEESLDVMIVALRIFNKEWEANEKPDSSI